MVPISSLPTVNYTGSSPSSIYTGAAGDATPGDLTALHQFEQDAKKGASIDMFYQQWGATDGTQNFQTSWMDAIRQDGSIPEITWEPWVGGGGVDQPAYSL